MQFSSRVRALAGSTAAAALLGFLGIKATREIGAWRDRVRILEEWQEPAGYNPKVILLYRANQLREHLQEKGYGVIEVNDSSQIAHVAGSTDSICAIVSGHELEKKYLPPFLPYIRAGPKVISRLESAVEQESNRAKLLLYSIAGYHEATAQAGFHEAGQRMRETIAKLFEMRRFIMRKDSYDAHRGGVISSLKTGTPINPGTDYGSLEGLCIKLESVDAAEIKSDHELFGEMGAVLAGPRFYVEFEGAIAVVRDYFIGPTLAEGLSLIAENGNQSEIVRRTLNAVFDIAARYHHHKRRSSPLPSSGAVLQYYRESLGKAFETLAPLAGFPVEKSSLEGLLDEPFLADPKWYTRILDISLPNIKLRIGIEQPGIETLRKFYLDGGIREEREIRAALGFYDQGFRDRHIVDAFARAGFSAYISDYGTDAWIGYAKSFFMREYSAGSRIPVSDFLNFRQHMAQLISALLPNGVATPNELAENFFAMSVLKLFRLAEDALNGAKRNELLFAKGEIMQEDYRSHRERYLQNFLTHSRGLGIVALTGAEYFEHYSHAITFSNIFSNMKRALRAARNEENYSFRNPLSGKLMAYYRMGSSLQCSMEKVGEMLGRVDFPYHVEFKAESSV